MDFSQRTVDQTFALYLDILKEMRCDHPCMSDLLLPDGHESCVKETEWRCSFPPTPWTGNALGAHIAEWKNARLRWEGVHPTSDVRESKDFQDGWGLACRALSVMVFLSGST